VQQGKKPMRQAPEEWLIGELIEHGVEQHGHFILNSGRHTDTKWDMEVLLDYPKLLRPIMYDVAAMAYENDDELVIAAPKGAQDLAKHGWSFGYPPLAHVNKHGPRLFTIDSSRDRQKVTDATRVTIFEDAVTTGGTPAALAAVIKTINPAIELDLVAIAIRSPLLEQHKALFRTCQFLVEVDIPSWRGENCENCPIEL
jgi:orotate phosphoribosyltransferase